MSAVTGNTDPGFVVEKLFTAPLDNPELLPTLLPLILGAVVLELYFGMYSREELGWNTSVGNAVIWVTTGLSLLMTSNLGSAEKNAVFFLVGFGVLVGYMDFFHQWPSTVAFLVSSSGIVYSLAYVTVIFVKTGIPVNTPGIKAAVAFIIGINIVFKIIQSMIAPRDGFPRR